MKTAENPTHLALDSRPLATVEASYGIHFPPTGANRSSLRRLPAICLALVIGVAASILAGIAIAAAQSPEPGRLPHSAPGPVPLTDISLGGAALPDGNGVSVEVATWLQLHPAASPSARASAGVAYDSARDRVVLFGGVSGTTSLGDTWEWDGANWIQRFPVTSPPARASHSLAYDSVRGHVVLFGGAGNGVYFADTWEWDGTTWQQQFPLHSPLARTAFAMAYDEARGRVVLFGGYALSDETWEWDGTDWTLLAPAISPPARQRLAMAYDGRRGVIVLYGGVGSVYYGDTWEWDG
jgi:hypothetical protein